MNYENEYLGRVAFGEQKTVAAGAAPAARVLDARGMSAFTVVLQGNAATYQACDAAGTPVPGSTAKAATSEARVDAYWGFFLITPDAGSVTCMVL